MGEAGPSIPPAMVNVVMKLLRRDPEQRFQSARELRDALQRVSSGASGEADAATLKIVTDEPGVRVAVRDGRNVVGEGPTPLDARGIPAGSYTIEVRDPRYEPAEASATLSAGAVQELTLATRRRTPTAPPKPRRGSRKGRLIVAVLLLAGVGAAAWAQPWGRNLDRSQLQAHVERGAISRIYLTDGGLEGGLEIAPIEGLEELRMPFFVSVGEGDVPETVQELRSRGVDVDVSWEVRRLTQAAVEAQSNGRYYGLDGGDVRSYALRLAELAPESPVAASLLFKVGERMAWDADAALQEGEAEGAAELVERCLDLVADQPRCLSVSEALES